MSVYFSKETYGCYYMLIKLSSLVLWKKHWQMKTALSSMLDVKDLGPSSIVLEFLFNVRRQRLTFSTRIYLWDTRFGMKRCKPVYTPMISKLLVEATSKEVDETHYQEIIGCLLYLAGRTRPHFCAAVNILSQCTANPRLSHLVAAKRVLRYLQGAKTLFLRIQKTGSDLTAYADADWGSDKTTRKSTTGVLMQ